MKIVGLMCVRDEADLLPQVYPHVRGLVDHLYVYEDGSQDDTWSIVKDADYAIRRVDDKARPEINRPNYHHLLEKVKQDFGKEEVWCVITMGDRFFLNKMPRQIVEEAGDNVAVEGVQLDFLRHRAYPWTEENDPWPDMSNIRHLCRWFKFDERCIVAFKLQKQQSYLRAKYPWPQAIKGPPAQYGYGVSDSLLLEAPFLEHPGRRSPKAQVWRYNSGSRVRSVKKNLGHDYNSFDGVMETQKSLYQPYRVFPWLGLHSLAHFLEIHNAENYKNKVSRRYFFWGMERMLLMQGCKLPPRTDVS